MKKSQRKKLFKIALILVMGGATLWFFVSPHPVKHLAESVQVKVAQPVAVPSSLEAEQNGSLVGDEKAQPERPSLSPEITTRHSPHHGPLRIAIIIDDVGLDLKGSQRAIKLPSFITLSFIPYSSRLREQTHEARDHGHELMLHMPMEPVGHVDPGPGALIVGLPEEELKQRLDNALASFVGFDGMNNHMGSKYTADTPGMELVVEELKQRNLFFLDSRTSAQTVGEKIAQQNGLPTISRDVFLDDDESLPSIIHQLNQTEHVALHKGYAVAIGHPHATTLQALEEWIPEIQKRGYVLVPVHDLINSQTEPK